MGLFNWLFARACRMVFNSVDVNKDGSLDSIEVELAVLRLYNIFNKRLPGWQDPPDREEIQASLKAFDSDNNGRLDPKEFEQFARQMLKSGPDQFFARMGKHAVVNTAVLPAAGLALKKGLTAAGGPAMPLAILAPVVGNIFSAIRGLVPAGL